MTLATGNKPLLNLIDERLKKLRERDEERQRRETALREQKHIAFEARLQQIQDWLQLDSGFVFKARDTVEQIQIGEPLLFSIFYEVDDSDLIEVQGRTDACFHRFTEECSWRWENPKNEYLLIDESLCRTPDEVRAILADAFAGRLYGRELRKLAEQQRRDVEYDDIPF